MHINSSQKNLPESIEWSTFAYNRARMSGEFDSKKDSQWTKFERKPQIFAKLSFRELWDSKSSDLHTFDNMAIIHWVKNRSKTER